MFELVLVLVITCFFLQSYSNCLLSELGTGSLNRNWKLSKSYLYRVLYYGIILTSTVDYVGIYTENEVSDNIIKWCKPSHYTNKILYSSQFKRVDVYLFFSDSCFACS